MGLSKDFHSSRMKVFLASVLYLSTVCALPGPPALADPAAVQDRSSCLDSYIGDGYCDDVCNNSGSDFDGGDCCGSSLTIKKTYCTVCACYQLMCPWSYPYAVKDGTQCCKKKACQNIGLNRRSCDPDYCSKYEGVPCNKPPCFTNWVFG